MGLPDENWNLPSKSYFKHMLLSELVKIAKIQEIANQRSISNNELFRYLDKLVSLFVSAERNSFADERIDFQEPLRQAQESLLTDGSQANVNQVEIDLKKVQNLNLVDFASFLDLVIRNTAKQNQETNFITLASRNIFRTHINRQISAKLNTMFYQDHMKPSANAYIDSMADSQAGLETQNLFDTMLDTTRNHFYIFDIDGTLKQEESNCLTHAVPDIDKQVREDLIALSRKPGNTVCMLTARCKEQILQSNIPYIEIPVITGYGRELVNNGRNEVLVGSEFLAETNKLVNHLHTLLKNQGVSQDQYQITQYAGSVDIRFTQNNFTQPKGRMMRALRVLMGDNQNDWLLSDIGGRDIFINNSRFKYDKGFALKRLLEEQKSNINENTNVYVLGDTSSDYKAMEALKEVNLPQGARKINIAVGEQLAGKPAVDVKLSSHHSVTDLLNWLAV
jgi:trehalose-6-phosphatase